MAKVLGDRIRERLRLLDKTQLQLAEAVGMRQPSISMILGGKVDRPGKLPEIADFLQTSPEYLLGKTNDAAPRPRRVQPVDRGGLRVPIISWVSAGRLVDAELPIPTDERTLLVDDLGRGDFFALTIDGDSMDRISPPNSVIVVNRADRQLVSGKPYVFAVKGQTTYKLWHPRPLYLAPYSTNPEIEPVFIERKRDLEVVGRVRRTILDL